MVISDMQGLRESSLPVLLSPRKILPFLDLLQLIESMDDLMPCLTCRASANRGAAFTSAASPSGSFVFD